MLAELIKSYLRRRPFVPFRIEKTSGQYFDVRNPEMVSATRDYIELGFPIEDGKQRFVDIATVHVISVELLMPVPEN